ncbi:MAG: hypothetical protein JXR48_18075 [Candidatus Delongbacteria bacterium]|nr:hypothetical protein [Candidatus Delongbacteria bacterium]MBN2836868.1 hypothetical protein [Candidatus Delongbacteria bacterium]
MFGSRQRTRKFSYYATPKKDKTSTLKDRLKINPLVSRNRKKEQLRFRVFLFLLLLVFGVFYYLGDPTDKEVKIKVDEFRKMSNE